MKRLLHRLYRAAVGVAFLGLLVAANEGIAAGDSGTADEAKAMLERAVAAVKGDEAAALMAFTAGNEDFKDRDLYVFCTDLDFVMTAHGANATLVGQTTKEWKDKAGKPFVEEMHAVASEGELNVVEYMWPRPGEEEPVQKASYVTVVGNQMCGVGYYK
jgi:signal transduction histidine kinase